MSVSRRKSLDFLTAFAEEAAKPSPSLFNLRDLVFLGLQSANRQTMLATLRLLSVVLQRHHPFARSLIRTLPGQVAKQRTIGALNAELQQLLSMASSIVHDPTLNDSYENYLKDSSFILESRLCVPPEEEEADDTPRLPLELDQNDPIVLELLRCLESFFTNSVIVNLALTEVLMSIASSHLVSLDGWLLVDPAKYVYDTHAIPGSESPSPEADTPSIDILERIRFTYREPSWSRADTPTLTSVIQNLVERTLRWKEKMPDFDILVAARRDLLQREDEPILSPIRSPQPSETTTRSQSRQPQMRSVNPESDITSPRGRSTRPVDTSSPRAAVGGSPLRDLSTFSTASRDSATSQTAAAEELRKRLAMPIQVDGTDAPVPANDESQPEPDQPDGHDEAAVVDEKPQTVTLGHILTNVVILYEFLLELSAMVQVRGPLFEEAGFPADDPQDQPEKMHS